MAEIASKADRIKQLCEAYGVAVRAGLITPCLQDENDIRALMGLQSAPAEVVADWAKTEGVRKPTTIQRLTEVIAGDEALEDDAPAPEGDVDNDGE